MTQPSFDVLSYSKDLESAGLPRQQADVIAKGVMSMVAQQFDSLPSREHFDTHMGRIDQRFEQIDRRFERVDECFERVDKRFEQVDKQFDVITGQLTSLELLKSHVNIHTWMLGLIIIVLVVPQLQRWLAVV